MAEKSKIPIRTYKRIELTGTVNIQNLIVILRAFERLTALQLLFPLPASTPRLSNIDRIPKLANAEQMKNWQN